MLANIPVPLGLKDEIRIKVLRLPSNKKSIGLYDR
jgi:hypothetical protein